MRTATFLAVLLLVVGCSESMNTPTVGETTSAVETTPVAFNVEGAPTVEFDVPGMMCAMSCAPKVREVLASQPGVKDVQVTYETKTAVVAVEEGVFDPEAAIHLLEDEYGFAGTALKQDASPPHPALPEVTTNAEAAKS